MSWNISITKVARNDVALAIDAANPTGQDDLAKERDEQVVIAKQVAQGLATSDALFSGDPGDLFNISIYGHANPEHKSRDGWANDQVSVAVSRAT
jgi:hypothetical protein